MALPNDVRRALETFLTVVDGAVPGLVDGLYVHGSLGFGEYVPGRSDVDAVVVLARRTGAEDLEVLEAAHRHTADAHPDMTLDAVHVTAADLAAAPDLCPDVPFVTERQFAPSGRFELNPVTWHGVARHGVHVRGVAPESLKIWTDDDALRAYTRNNLATYWRGQLDRVRANPTGASAAWVSEWCVLGVARLHHVLTTGTMTSKSGAGRYALAAFDPRWAPIVEDALAVRERQDQPPPLGDGSDGRRGPEVAAFMTMVIDDGLARS